MKILLIEDDAKYSEFIARGLREAGFAVLQAMDGETGLHHIATEPWDAAIVDVMLPKLDGISIVEKARAAGVNTPILILSARQSVDDRVDGLQAGGDDYLTKPFAFAELLARIRALLRRSRDTQQPTALAYDNLRLDVVSRKVTRGDRAVELTALEFSLLEYLMRNPGIPISKTMIMEHVWDYNFDPQTNVVEVRICRLRDKIDKGFEKKLIHTVRGMGYIFGEH